MKLKKIEQVNDFLAAVDKCKGQVILKSQWGDTFNLSSVLSRYVAMGALLGEHGDELEIFCDSKEDERYFLQFFYEHPEVE